MTRTYQELRSYSPLFDCDTARISMADDNGQEFFMLIPQRHARHRRAERYAALDLIGEAIDAGLSPGQVMVADTEWASLVAGHLRERAA